MSYQAIAVLTVGVVALTTYATEYFLRESVEDDVKKDLKKEMLDKAKGARNDAFMDRRRFNEADKAYIKANIGDDLKLQSMSNKMAKEVLRTRKVYQDIMHHLEFNNLEDSHALFMIARLQEGRSEYRRAENARLLALGLLESPLENRPRMFNKLVKKAENLNYDPRSEGVDVILARYGYVS